MGADSHSRGLFTRVTLPLAVFGLINQAARTVMAVIGPVLAVEFALSASELGLLAACMLAAYAAVQLPGGMALDRVGARNVQAALALVTAAGFALFALADSFATLVIARVIVGVGISAGLMAIIKANAQWFVPAKVALVTGIAVAIGGLGSVASTVPVAAALPALGWRGVLWVLCGLSAATALWIFASVPDRRGSYSGGLKTELGIMASILGSRVFWRFAPAVAMLSVLNFAYLGLWAGPWLRDVAGYDSRQSASTLLAYTVTMMVGALVVGAATSRAKARGYPPMLVTLACTAGQAAAQIGLVLQPAAPLVVGGLWMLFAFCVAGATAGYITVGQMFPPEQTARVATAVNTLTLAGAFVLQSATGWVLDFWPRTASGGWDPQGYSTALAFSLLLQLLMAARLLGGKR
ncbi:MAG TPA: MFS transporter [Burkholderiales bacterium]|jgi:predicted MFS family arabinose efflux permease